MDVFIITILYLTDFFRNITIETIFFSFSVAHVIALLSILILILRLPKYYKRKE